MGTDRGRRFSSNLGFFLPLVKKIPASDPGIKKTSFYFSPVGRPGGPFLESSLEIPPKNLVSRKRSAMIDGVEKSPPGVTAFLQDLDPPDVGLCP